MKPKLIWRDVYNLLHLWMCVKWSLRRLICSQALPFLLSVPLGAFWDSQPRCKLDINWFEFRKPHHQKICHSPQIWPHTFFTSHTAVVTAASPGGIKNPWSREIIKTALKGRSSDECKSWQICSRLASTAPRLWLNNGVLQTDHYSFNKHLRRCRISSLCVQWNMNTNELLCLFVPVALFRVCLLPVFFFESLGLFLLFWGDLRDLWSLEAF